MTTQLPRCWFCGAPVVLLRGQVPPMVACTGCPLRMAGATAAGAVANYLRQRGFPDEAYACTKCRRRTSSTFDTLGETCLCGGTIIRESTIAALDAEGKL